MGGFLVKHANAARSASHAFAQFVKRAQRLSCVCTIKKQEEMRKWLAHRTAQQTGQR